MLRFLAPWKMHKNGLRMGIQMELWPKVGYFQTGNGERFLQWETKIRFSFYHEYFFTLDAVFSQLLIFAYFQILVYLMLLPVTQHVSA